MKLYISQIASWLENKTGIPQQIINTKERIDIEYTDFDSRRSGIVDMTIIADADIKINSIHYSERAGVKLFDKDGNSLNDKKIHVVLWTDNETMKDEQGFYMDSEGAINGVLVIQNPDIEVTGEVVNEMLAIDDSQQYKSSINTITTEKLKQDEIQALMDEFYKEWQKEENKGKDKWDILDGLSSAHQIAVAFGNFNYQVENGGIEQWIYNGYFHDDAEKLIEYLEIGAELDERCRTILTNIYLIDQYAQETDCDREGNFYDEDGDSCFIGDMINSDTFDTWYYAKCGEENWWQVVCGIIDKVEARESALVNQDEHDGKDSTAAHPIWVYIENVHDNSIGGFTIPLPARLAELQGFLEASEITGWQDMEILEVSSGIGDLGDVLNKNIKRTMSQETLDELNYLAARIQTLQGGNGYDVFSAIIESKQDNVSIAEIINLTFIENLNCFDLMPAFTNEQYGDFLIEQVGVDAHANAFSRLEDSDEPEDNELAR